MPSSTRKTAGTVGTDEGTWTFAREAIERSGANADSDPGTGVAGDIWQHLGACDALLKLLTGATGVFAIIGQCGVQCSSTPELPVQQRPTADAGPAKTPRSNHTATSLERMFTDRTVLTIAAQE